jgi:hypothetical protein
MTHSVNSADVPFEKGCSDSLEYFGNKIVEYRRLREIVTVDGGERCVALR